MRTESDAQLARRLEELAQRAERTGQSCFSPFLSPPEADMALAAARRAGVEATLEGGYEDAERRVARFRPVDAWDVEPFPIAALALTWPHQSAPGHRDVLGSVMGLGITRQCVGDIVLESEMGYLFAERRMAEHIAAALTSAGRVKLQVKLLNALPEVKPPEGSEVRDTVSSLRLDAVLASGFGLSRSDAAELIAAGRVKLRHLPNERSDARVAEGDTISARGYGRLRVEEVGLPTRKGRLPLRLMRYGEIRRR